MTSRLTNFIATRCLAGLCSLFLSADFSYADDAAAAGGSPPSSIEIAEIKRDGPVEFTKDILPIFRQNCAACHNVKDAKGELVLETPAAIAKGGETGPAIVAGKGMESLLLRVSAKLDRPFMPPKNNKVGAVALTPAELGLLKLWIDQGGKGDAVAAPSPATTQQAVAPLQPLPAGLNPIYSIALTPEGQFAACNRANQIFIYSLPGRRLLTRVTDPALPASADEPGAAHRDMVQSLAFSPDGTLLASGGNREVKIWQRPEPVAKLTVPAEVVKQVNVLAMSPDGKAFAVGSDDGSIRLFDSADGKLKSELKGHTGAITSLRITEDGAKLISGSADQTARVWTVADGATITRVDTPFPVTAALAMPGGKELLTAGGDNAIRRWALFGPAQPIAAEIPGPVTAMASTPDRKRIAAAGADNVIRWVDVETGKVGAAFPATAKPILAIAFGAAGKRLLAACEDGSVTVFDADNTKPLLTFIDPAGSIATAVLRPDGKQAATVTTDGRIKLWRLDVPAVREFGPADEVAATIGAASLDKKWVATAGTAGGKPAVLVRKIATGKIARTLLGAEGAVSAIAFSADGNLLAAGSADHIVRVWSVVDGVEQAKFTGHATPISALAFHVDGSRIISASADGAVKVWTTVDDKEIQSIPGQKAAIGMAIGANDRLTVATADALLNVFDLNTGEPVRSTALGSSATALAMSRDGTRFAVATADKKIRLLDADGLLQQTWDSPVVPASLAFSPHGQRLLTVGENRASMFSVADGLRTEELTGAAFATFGEKADEVWVAGDDKISRAIPLRFERMLSAVPKKPTRVLYAKDGSLLIVASEDGFVRAFNPADGVEKFAANHGSPVRDLAMSPDGAWLASAGDDRLVKLWAAVTGVAVPKPQLGPMNSPATHVAFSGDGARVLVAGATGEDVVIFDREQATPIERIAGAASPVAGLLTLDSSKERGDAFFLASADKSLRILRTTSRGRFDGHTGVVTSLANLPGEGGRFLSGSADGTVREWTLAKAGPQRQFAHGGAVSAVAVRADGKVFASAGGTFAKLFDAGSGKEIATMKGDRAAAELAQLAERQSNFALAEVTVWQQQIDSATRRQAAGTQAGVKANEMKALADKALADKQMAVKAKSDARDAAEKVLAAKTEVMNLALQTQATAEQAVNATTVAAAAAKKAVEDAKAAAAAADPVVAKLAAMRVAAAEKISVEAAATAQKSVEAKKAADAAVAPEKAAQADVAAKATVARNEFAQATAEVESARGNVSSAELAIVAASNDLASAERAIADRKAGQAVAQAAVMKAKLEVEEARVASAGSDRPITSLVFSPDSGTVWLGDGAGVVRAYQADTGAAAEVLRGHANAITSLVAAPDGTVLSGSADRTVKVWDANPPWTLKATIGTGDEKSPLIDRVLALAFSPDGSLLATGGGVPSRSGELKIWSVATGQLFRDIPEAHSDTVYGLSFSGDGTRLASGGADKFARVWDVATGKLFRSFEGHTNHVLSVNFRYDGRVLVTGGADNTVKVWDVQTGEPRASNAGLSKAEITSVTHVGFTDRFIATAGDGAVRLVRERDLGVDRAFDVPGSFVYAGAATPDGILLLTGGYDGVLRLRDARDGKTVADFAPPEK